MKRMLDDYFDRFYNKLAVRHKLLRKDKFSQALSLTAWKEGLKRQWDAVHVSSSNLFDAENNALMVGDPFKGEITLHVGELNAKNVGVEVVFFKRVKEVELELKLKEELRLVKVEGQEATYACDIEPKLAGVYEYGFRVYPKSDLLPHQQDVGLVKWV